MSKEIDQDESQLVSGLIFSARPKVGKHQLEPLSAGRIAFLEERNNPIAGDLKEGDEVSPFSLHEVMMVSVLDGDELVELSLDDDEKAWQREVRKFAVGLSDDDLNQFWSIVQKELKAIAMARTVPKKKRARRRKTGG